MWGLLLVVPLVLGEQTTLVSQQPYLPNNSFNLNLTFESLVGTTERSKEEEVEVVLEEEVDELVYHYIPTDFTETDHPPAEYFTVAEFSPPEAPLVQTLDDQLASEQLASTSYSINPLEGFTPSGYPLTSELITGYQTSSNLIESYPGPAKGYPPTSDPAASYPHTNYPVLVHDVDSPPPNELLDVQNDYQLALSYLQAKTSQVALNATLNTSNHPTLQLPGTGSVHYDIPTGRGPEFSYNAPTGQEYIYDRETSKGHDYSYDYPLVNTHC